VYEPDLITRAIWLTFLCSLTARGLSGIKLVKETPTAAVDAQSTNAGIFDDKRRELSGGIGADVGATEPGRESTTPSIRVGCRCVARLAPPAVVCPSGISNNTGDSDIVVFEATDEATTDQAA